MDAPKITCRDLSLQRTDKDGNTWTTHHRVWDAERFMASELAAAKKVGGTVALAPIPSPKKPKQ